MQGRDLVWWIEAWALEIWGREREQAEKPYRSIKAHLELQT